MSSARSPRRRNSRFKKHFIRRLSSWLVLSTSLTVLVGKALNDVQAAGTYWDINGGTPGSSGSVVATGVWDATNPYWNDSLGVGTGAIWSSGDTAIFAAGTNAVGNYTVTVNGTQGIGGITFEDGFVTLSEGTLQMTAHATFEVTAINATVTSTVTGGFDLIKSGNGTLVLGGSNSYTGRTVLNAGTLSISADTNLGAVPSAFASDHISFSGNSTLQFTGTSNPTLDANRGISIGAGVTATMQVVASTNAVTYGGAIAGAAGTTFRKSGPGTLNLSASSPMAGTVTIDGGTLRLMANGALASAAGVVLGNRSVFILDNTATNLGDRTVGPLSSSGGTINFLGNAAATTETLGALTLNAGALTINTSPGAGGSILTIPTITRNAGGTLYLNGTGLGGATNQVILSTAPALTNSILKYVVVNNGTLTSFATYTTSGGSNQSVSPLLLASHNQGSETTWVAASNARPTADVTLSAGRSAYTLTLDSGIDILAPTADRILTLGGGVLQTGGVSQVFGTSSNDNILAFGTNEALFYIIGSLQLDRGNTTSLTGTGGFTKSGAGILILNGVSSLSGAFNVNEGTLELRGATSLMATAAPINLNGATLRLSNDAATTYTGTLTVNADSTIQVDRVTAGATATTHTIGALTIGGGRVLSISSNDITAATNYGLTTGALTLTSGGVIFDVANNGSGIGTLTVGTITGAFPITKTGAGDLVTSSTSAGYTSPVEIQAGRVGWSGSSGTITEAQTFFGAGGIVKAGAGQVNLTGVNPFTGGVAVNAGTLGFSTVSDNGGLASNLGQGTDGISLGGGNLSFVGSIDQSTNRAISVSAASTLSASGTANAKITYTGPITIGLTADGSAITFSGNTTSSGVVTGGLTMTGTTADATMNSGNWTFRTGTVTLADDFTVTGASTVLNLNTTDALTFLPGSADATLQIQAGATVNIGADNAVTALGFDRLLVGQGGAAANNTLNMGAFDLTTARLDLGSATTGLEGTINGTGDLTVTTTLNLSRGTINANLISSVAVVKSGLGTLTLSGNNNLTSTTATSIAAGNLVLDYTVNNTNKLNPAAGLSMAGGTLTLNGFASDDTAQTVASIAMANGSSVIALNNGTGHAITLNLNAITRTVGQGTIRFVLPANGAVTTTTANNVATTMGILGGYATVDNGVGVFFARNDGANNIAAANTTTQDDVSLWVTGDNVTDDTGFTGLVDRVAINSLRFNSTGLSGVSVGPGGLLGIATGGILQTANVTGASSLISGRVASGGQE